MAFCGRGAPQRATVYRILQQTDCLPPLGWAVGRGQARPPEPGEALAYYRLSQSPQHVRHHQSRPGCCRKVAPLQEQSYRERGEMSPQAAVVHPPAQLYDSGLSAAQT